ncbi:alpha/beta hydrolase [Cytophagaceae bacterium DM2B3-1]|uniref:Alpha/beta hydrolase n=1 Tax=Xanthocytophaga flava TaxID=3048013 RepID=A0ABT7CRI3_9BACT|nr:alpha/beta hydrolase [Xanthocytophaga flavus]MDJ1468583.1 alpha/beta hydrolase [Xanthocytophaga flavus]MDJ1496363.1 alpha/beta hydrolase [Xanthocytophaga flavus]
MKVSYKSITFTLSFFICLITFSYSQIPAIEVKVSGKGKPVLFIPHIGCPGEMWQYVANELGKTYQCHIISLAGFAGQTPLDSNYTQQYLTQIRNYIKTKKLKEITLLGMNYGGFLALQLHNQPAVSKLIVIDTYPFLAQILNPAATATDATTYASQAKSGYLAASATDFAQMMYQTGKGMITHDTVKARQYAHWLTQSDRKTIASVLADQLQTDLRAQLPSIKIPVLTIGTWYFGKNLKKMPLEEGYKMHENFFSSLPNHKTVLTETGKDFMHWDEPAWFVKEVITFINKPL